MKFPLILAIAACIAISACAVNSNPAIPQAVQGLDTASHFTYAVAQNDKLAQDTLKSLKSAGKVSAAEYAKTDTILQNIARENDATIAAIRASDAVPGVGSGWQADIQALVALGKTLTPQDFALSDKSAQADFSGVVAVLLATLQAVASTFGGVQ